jgi:hypothetical protein
MFKPLYSLIVNFTDRSLLLPMLVLFSGGALSQQPVLTSSNKTREGREVVEQARAKSDIRELPAFTMKATVKIENQGKLVEGQYALFWNGPNQWREETSLPGFDEIRIGGPGTVTLKRSLDFVPLRVYQLHRTLAYGRGEMTVRPDEGIKRVRARKVNGVEAKCAEITGKVFKREICADAFTGALLRDRPFVDADFAAVGTKIFPRFLKYVEEGKTVAEAQISELKTTEPSPSSAFDVPAGAVSRPGCLNPTVGHLIRKVNPSYPESDRRTYTQGTVVIYAVIGVDGSLHDPRVVSGVSPGMNRASLDAVQQWHYDPFSCQDSPVEVETVLTVNYSLR